MRYALLSLGTIACAPGGLPRDYHVRISPEATPEQAVTVVEALESWSGAAIVHFDTTVSAEKCGWTPVAGSAGCLWIGFADHTSVVAMCGGAEEKVACSGDSNYWGISTPILVGTDLPADLARNATMHEIGHALGLRHEPHTVMSADLRQNPGRVTQADVDQYERLR
jgi:hypothetical protein